MNMKSNIAFNLYFRAVRLNSDKADLFYEFNRIDLSLLALGYPLRVLKTQRSKALKHFQNNEFCIPSPSTNNIKRIYFTTTRSSVSTSKEFNKMFSTAMKILGNSRFFSKNKVEIKRSFRQPPNLRTRYIFSSLKQKVLGPVPCGHHRCNICHLLYTDHKWTSNNGVTLSSARVTCSSRFLIYIMVENETNQTLYVGQTQQKLNKRFGDNRKQNSWLRNENFKIVPIGAAKEAVKRIEQEQILINCLAPTKNKQRHYFWWNAQSNYDHTAQP